MHDGEAEIDAALVRRLVAPSSPSWPACRSARSAPRARSTPSTGWGTGCTRGCPALPRYVHALEREWRWLPELAPGLTLRIPEPVALGQPTAEYPFTWAIYRWIDGRPYADQLVDDERQAARDLARFVTELRRIPPPADAPAGGRQPLAELDAATRTSITRRGRRHRRPGRPGRVGTRPAGARVGRPARLDPQRPAAPQPAGRRRTPARGHRLRRRRRRRSRHRRHPRLGGVRPRRARGVPRRPRRRRRHLDRARGIALHQAAALIPYYAVSNPAFAELGQRTVEQILADVRVALAASRPPVGQPPPHQRLHHRAVTHHREHGGDNAGRQSPAVTAMATAPGTCPATWRGHGMHCRKGLRS